MRRSNAAEVDQVVPDVESGTGAWPKRYSSDRLLERANAWAARQGYPPITRATFRELRKDRILEGPRQRGQGWGPGPAWDWSALDYRRLLQVIRLRALGVHRRAHQRVALYVLGADWPVPRRDLLSVYAANANRMNRHHRTDSWRPAVQRLTDEILDLGAPGAFLARLGPEAQQAAARAGQGLVTNPGVKQLVSLSLNLWFRWEAGVSRGGVKQALAQLPPDLRALGDDFLELVVAGAGLLAPCEDGNSANAVVEAFTVLSDDELRAIRDFLLEWDVLCRGVIELMDSLPGDDIDPTLRLIVEAMRMVAPAFRVRNLEDRLILMGIFSVFAARRPGYRRFVQLSVECRLGRLLLEVARRGLLSRPGGPTESEMDEALDAVGVRPETRSRLRQAEPSNA